MLLVIRNNLIAAGLALSMLGAAPAVMAQSVPGEVLQGLSAMVPGVLPDQVQASPVDGVYEATFGPHVIYVTGDGRHVLRGDLFDVAKRVNLTAQRRKDGRLNAIDRLGEDSMIVFAPTDPPKHVITVFTDVSCGYCAKLHSEMAQYNALGIEIRYLAFPRAGVASSTYDTMVSVWCADDQQSAMTRAKQGKSVEAKTCDNPVSQHFAMGELFGVTGTPTIVLDNGDLVPGYLPPERMLQKLESASPSG